MKRFLGGMHVSSVLTSSLRVLFGPFEVQSPVGSDPAPPASSGDSFNSPADVSYERRRQWIENRIRINTSILALDICAYTAMSNHYHPTGKLWPEQTE